MYSSMFAVCCRAAGVDPPPATPIARISSLRLASSGFSALLAAYLVIDGATVSRSAGGTALAAIPALPTAKPRPNAEDGRKPAFKFCCVSPTTFKTSPTNGIL